MPKHLPIEFKSTKPFFTIPQIIYEYLDTDGVRMYQCENNRVFIAEIYDRNFTFAKGKIKPKHYRDGEIGKAVQLKGIPSIKSKLKQ